MGDAGRRRDAPGEQGELLLSSLHMNDSEEPFDPLRGVSTPPPVVVRLREQVRPAVVSVISLTLLTGCIFPLVLFVLGRLLYPDQAAGSLVTRNGVVVGSRLIGQTFTQPEYFHTRPSIAGAGYGGTASGGTNLGPFNPKLIQDVRQLAEDYRRRNGLALDATIPIDAVTRSGSGLDPHISPPNAALQVPRVARARGLSEDAVRRLVTGHTQGRQLGFMGNPRVSVLDLNLDLDLAAPLSPR
jgi:potassium-transporting ATPase KdpC subunit